jgi:hypothetical protein
MDLCHSREKMSTPATMLALRKTTPGPSYTLAAEPVPVPGDAEVRIQYPTALSLLAKISALKKLKKT